MNLDILFGFKEPYPVTHARKVHNLTDEESNFKPPPKWGIDKGTETRRKKYSERRNQIKALIIVHGLKNDKFTIPDVEKSESNIYNLSQSGLNKYFCELEQEGKIYVINPEDRYKIFKLVE